MQNKLYLTKLKSKFLKRYDKYKKVNFTDTWRNSYSFVDVAFVFGNSTIKGIFSGSVRKKDEILFVNAKAEYYFSDTFTDPLDIRQKKIGSSALENIPYDPSKSSWYPGNLGAAYLAADSEFVFGKAYEITGTWTTKITGSISSRK